MTQKYFSCIFPAPDSLGKPAFTWFSQQQTSKAHVVMAQIRVHALKGCKKRRHPRVSWAHVVVGPFRHARDIKVDVCDRRPRRQKATSQGCCLCMLTGASPGPLVLLLSWLFADAFCLSLGWCGSTSAAGQDHRGRAKDTEKEIQKKKKDLEKIDSTSPARRQPWPILSFFFVL